MKGNNVHCNICDSNFRKFMPYGRFNPRDNALCPNCLSLERHRLIWHYLQTKTDFFSSSIRVLHIAPEHCFIDRFEAIHKDNYITADIESPLAKVKMDVHDIPFGENEFDAVFCNHVLEHVESDVKVLAEFYRVLKPGGWAILQCPVDYRLETTYEDPSITDPREREKAFGQDDHVRVYGRDYGKHLAQVGFEVTEDHYTSEIPEKQAYRMGLDRTEIMYFCKKV